MDRLNLNVSDSQAQQFLQSKLLRRISQISKRLATRDVVKYICLIVLEMNKSKNEVREDLDEFFEEKTVEFVNWMWSTLPKFADISSDSPTESSTTTDQLKLGGVKKRRCRDWPECERGEKCEFFHPSKEVLSM